VDFSAEREGLDAWPSAMWLELEVEYPEVLLRRSGVELARIFDGLARVTGTPPESAGDTG
jgi:hypothetical protein